MMEQMIIPAVADMKAFEYFLKSDFTICICMNIHVALLRNCIKMAKKCGKKVFVHLDLIKGISADEYGCEYVCQEMEADGIISTRRKAIETAKKLKKTGILRLFLIDSQSLESGISLCNSLEPDYMEVLPGIACSIFPHIISRTKVPIMGGGLIRTGQEIQTCFDAGAAAITISDIKEAERYLLERKS